MKKSILIISAGPGLSRSVAERFGQEGFRVGLISLDRNVLNDLEAYLSEKNIETFSAVANVLDPVELKTAIDQLSAQAGGFDVVHYNAAIVKSKDIMEETADVLVKEFTIDAAHALLTLQATYSSLKEKHGALLLTGGGLGVTPHPAWGSLSIGKAALRSLALQLHDRLKDENIYVGLLTIDGLINPQSPTHNPAALAGLFWQLYSERAVAEIHHSENAPATITQS